MTYFLTSNPCLAGEPRLNPENGFVEALRAALKNPCRGLFICSDPDGHAQTDRFAGAIRAAFEASGLSFSAYAVLDGRNEAQAAPLVREAGLIVLAGGHVPTQNRFLARIDLRGLLPGTDAVIVGISAGSMNSAEVVYAHPELPGEAVSGTFRRFLPGLGLTKAMVLPHFPAIRGHVLDGLRVIEDIAFPDSTGRIFYALADGSYLLGRDGREEVHGAAWTIRDGAVEQLCRAGDTARLPQ